jgi:hypothetical protein
VPPPLKNRSRGNQLKGNSPSGQSTDGQTDGGILWHSDGTGDNFLFGFYWIISHNLLEIPSYVAMLVSLSLFGLGFIGLSYGIFSASWG